jgi:hypothetical protein
VCGTLYWLDCSQSGLWRTTIHTTMYRVRLLRFPVGSVAHWNCVAEFVFGSLQSGVSVDNEIGAEGAKALGDALKDNTTLTSLSLDLYSELCWFRWWIVLPGFFLLQCVERYTGWTVQSGLWRATINIIMYQVRLLRLPVGSVAHWNCLLNSYLDLSSGVSL